MNQEATTGTPRLYVAIRDESDLAVARRHVRELSADQGLEHPEAEALATAVTEVARNILDHALRGGLWLEPARQDLRRGVRVTACDEGPGIPNIEQAMQDGYSTGCGLGLGLSSARSLTDEFGIDSGSGRGTTVTLCKWSSAVRSHPG